MMNLIKCHFAYLLNKVTLFILPSVNIIMIISLITNIGDEYSDNFNSYYFSSIVMVKICFCFISIFLFSISIYKQNDYYAYYILTSNVSRIKYITSKIILITGTVLINFVFLFIIFLLIGFLLQDYFYFQIIFLYGFIETCLIVFIYGLYGMLLMQITQNLFTIIFPYIFMILTSDLGDSLIETLLMMIFPNTRDVDIINLIHLIWLTCLLIVSNIIIFCKKDLHY